MTIAKVLEMTVEEEVLETYSRILGEEIAKFHGIAYLEDLFTEWFHPNTLAGFKEQAEKIVEIRRDIDERLRELDQ